MACHILRRATLGASPWLSLFDTLFGPLVTLFEWSTKRFLSVLSFLPGRNQVEAKAEASLQGTIELDMLSSQHRQYVMNLVDLERKRVKDIFLPWQQVVTLHEEQTAPEVETTILAAGHTRLPVMNEDTVIGILNEKEFFALMASGAEQWQSLMRPAVELQDQTPLLVGLRLLQDRRMPMGIVYSSKTRLGIVTLEDILEEIVGEIYDEDDDGALKRILTSSPKTRGYWSQHSNQFPAQTHPK